MKPRSMPFLAICLCIPTLSMAQMADNAVPESKNLPGSTATATEPEVPTNMVQASLNDPQATAEDLGLASPGTGISLPALNK